MKTHYSNDPVIQRTHEQLNRIKWILSARKPYPKHSDPANETVEESNPLEDFLNGFMGKDR